MSPSSLGGVWGGCGRESWTVMGQPGGELGAAVFTRSLWDSDPAPCGCSSEPPFKYRVVLLGPCVEQCPSLLQAVTLSGTGPGKIQMLC